MDTEHSGISSVLSDSKWLCCHYRNEGFYQVQVKMHRHNWCFQFFSWFVRSTTGVYSSSFFFKMICRTISAILGRISLTETFGPQASTTLPLTSMRYFQKFQLGSFPEDSVKKEDSLFFIQAHNHQAIIADHILVILAPAIFKFVYLISLLLMFVGSFL